MAVSVPFRSRLTRSTTVDLPSPSGNRYQIEYLETVDDDGNWVLKETGKLDTYLYIQSNAEDSTISAILARYTNGDIDALRARVGTYVDLGQAPKSLAHAQQILIDAMSQWEQLPLALRNQWSNNPAQFFASVGDGSAPDVIRKYADSLDKRVKPAAEPASSEGVMSDVKS